MKRTTILSALVWVAWSATTAQAGDINGAAVLGGGLGGAAGAAVGSAGGRSDGCDRRWWARRRSRGSYR